MPFQFYCPQGHLLEGHESQAGQQSQCPLCGSVFFMPVIPGATPSPGAAPGAMPGQTPAWPGYGQPAPGYGQQPVPGYGQPMPGFAPGAPVYGQPAYGPQNTPVYGPQPGYPMHPGAYPGYPPDQGAPGQPGGVPPGYGQSPWTQPSAGPGGAQTAGGFAGYPTPGSPVGDSGPGLPVIKTEEKATSAATAPSEPAAPAAPPEEEKKEPTIVRIPCPQGHELQTPTDMLNQEVLCPICSTQFHLRYEDSIEFKQEQAELRRRKAEQLNQAALKWSIIAAVVVVLSIVGMVIYLAVRSPGEDSYAPHEPPAEKAPPEAAGDDTTGDAKNPE
ncbi:MAG TPA: hypothetical protein VG125_27295 [Pirellulales bacterium]|jgi:hypothetical protein|nr:hypothetical protein [Pirellulales bacterium]